MASTLSTSSWKEYSLSLKYCSIFFLFCSIHSISCPSRLASSSSFSSLSSSSSSVSLSPKQSSSMHFRICAAVRSGAIGISRLQMSLTPGRSLAAPKQRQPPKPGISLPWASYILAFLMARQSLPPSSLMRISQWQSSRRRRLMSSLRALISFSGRALFWISSIFSMMLVVTCFRQRSHSQRLLISRMCRSPRGRSSSSRFTSARFMDHHLFSMPWAFSQFRAIQKRKCYTTIQRAEWSYYKAIWMEGMDRRDLSIGRYRTDDVQAEYRGNSSDCIVYNCAMEVDFTASAAANKITLAMAYPAHPNLTYNFRLNLTVSQQRIGSQQAGAAVFQKLLYIPEKNISVGPLQGGCIYKVDCQCSFNSVSSSKTQFVFVPAVRQESEPEELDDQYSEFQESAIHSFAPRAESQVRQPRQSKPKAKVESSFSRSEGLMKLVGKSVGITNEKRLDSYLLQSRKCRNTKQFINSKQQTLNGSQKRAIEKQEMLLKGRMILGEVYGERQGMRFFRNDWFMGPFYSYDHNEAQLAKQSGEPLL